MGHYSRSLQWSLFGSLGLYPLIFLASTPIDARLHRLAQSRQAISIFHVTLQTLLSAICLQQESHALAAVPAGFSINSQPPIIATRSLFAQCITAIETGYLLQDSLVLLYMYLKRHKKAPNASRLKSFNFLHLGLHHAILGGCLSLLQYYIAHDWDKGILVIVALHLMNASSIFGTVRWFLINFRPSRGRLIAITTAMYFASFAIFRVYVVLWVVWVYGKQCGYSTWTAVKVLRLPCKVGTGTMLLVNSLWLIDGIRKLTRRTMSGNKKE